MPVLLLKLPEVETAPNSRPRHCPYCGSQILQRWGRVTKTIRDTHHQVTEVHRYRCTECGRTFRDYPEGIDRAYQTLPVRHLAALAWAMGLSCRDVVNVFKELGVSLSRMTVWRDGQELIDQMNLDQPGELNPGFSLERNGSARGRFGRNVTIVIDSGRGQPVELGVVEGRSPEAVRTWLEPILEEKDVQISLLGTDGLVPIRRRLASQISFT